MQPEKFYEACITYNIIDFYRSNSLKRIFPFSITQYEENREGYDFGYDTNDYLFMIQYKKPERLMLDNKYTWKIDEEQLKTILNSGMGKNIFYCLPGFHDYKSWYEALKMTYFALPSDIITYLKRNNRKSISSDAYILKSWIDIHNLIENKSLRKGLVHNMKYSNLNQLDILMKIVDEYSACYLIK